jgi:hypothetical protein
MLYHESSVDDPSPSHAYRYPYENTLCGNSSLSAGDQITAAHNRSGDAVIALTRAYDYRAPWVDVAAANSNCSGVVFEMRANEAGWFNVPQGIIHVLATGKKCYVLMGPSPFTSNSYLTDFGTGMRALRDGGVPLSNANLFIVICAYSRPDVNFLGSGSTDPNSNQNSALAAAQWLLRFKNRSVQ